MVELSGDGRLDWYLYWYCFLPLLAMMTWQAICQLVDAVIVVVPGL